MLLTKKQEEGLNLIIERYNNGEKYTVISGYAGTGKSTLVKYAIDALGVDRSRVAYATFTGKAAEILRKKGNPGAMTLHRLLYEHSPRPDGSFYRKVKKSLPYKVIVVDEVSMVPKDMIDLLSSHRVYVIYLGDPFQLPQIDKNQSHDLLDKPHVFLDEVMRQAAESEIIQVTMKIRAGETLDYFNGKEVKIMPYSELVDGCFDWADQVIVGTNAKRRSVNDQIRKKKGFSGLPQSGDKMICLRNYWDDIANTGDALVNGTTGIIVEPTIESFYVPPWVPTDKRKIECVQGPFLTEDGSLFGCVNMDKSFIESGNKTFDWKSEYILNKNKERVGDIIPREFDYGYAITGHKAQGSQWENVLVLEEKFPFDKTEHARWLYTACTRASEKLVLVR